MPEICPVCGVEVEKADKICIKCGHKIKKLGYQADKLEDAVISIYVSELKSIRSFTMFSLLFGALSIALAFFLGGGFFMAAFGVFIIGFAYMQMRRRKDLEDKLRRGEIV